MIEKFKSKMQEEMRTRTLHTNWLRVTTRDLMVWNFVCPFSLVSRSGTKSCANPSTRSCDRRSITQHEWNRIMKAVNNDAIRLKVALEWIHCMIQTRHAFEFAVQAIAQ